MHDQSKIRISRRNGTYVRASYRRKAFFWVVSLAGWVAFSHVKVEAQPPAVKKEPALEVDPTYDFQRWTLPNGLTVIVLEDHSSPIVAVQVWYRVGSKDEDPKRQGFAHMFEHMMFRGTDVLGPEKHFEYIRATGGDCNAFTSFDHTTYVNELPSNQLELALWLEAERMAFLKIDEESFHKERAVVEEERRMGSLNTPYGTVPEKLLPVIFTKHPYQWTPIGQIPHLRAATIDELQAFWDKYYVPSNATLVVVGDVNHKDVRTLVVKYFAWIPDIPKPDGVTVKEPVQTEPRSITIPEKKGPVPVVGFLYRGVPAGHADELPLQMLMQILGDGESSRLYKDLVKEQQIAQMAVAGSFSLQDDGLAGAGAVMMPWANKQKILDAVQAHIDRVRAEPVTDRELEKVKNQILSEETSEALAVESKAQKLGLLQTVQGDAGHAHLRLSRIRAVTKEDVHRAASTYLDPQRQIKVIVQPEVGGMIKSLFGMKDEVDEGAAPVPPPVGNRVAKRGGQRANLQRPPSFPSEPPRAKLLEKLPDIQVEEVWLHNNLKVVIVPNHEVPFVTITFGIRYGAWTDTKPGTAAMALELVTKGTTNHTAAALAEKLEFNAIEMNGSASMDVARVSASCVKEKLDLATRLLAEVVRAPTLPQSELDILKQQTLMGLMVEAETPEYVADRELRRRIFGSHPYARTATGEPGDVKALEVDDLKQWWGKYVRPETSVLFIAGDVDVKDATQVAYQYFVDWTVEGPVPEPKIAELPKPAATQIYLVDRPGSVQSQIRVGHMGVTRADEAYFNGVVLSQIFGGAFNSRLNKAIRIEKGLTYGARGGFQASRFAGTFTASTFTKNPTTAQTVQVLLQEIDRMRSSPPEETEIDQARSYLVGSFAGQRETPQATVNDLWLIDYAQLPKDYLSRYLAGVKKTTADDVQRASQKLIHPENLAIVVVGEAEKIKADLEKIAPVILIQPPAEEAKSPPDGTDKPESKDKEKG